MNRIFDLTILAAALLATGSAPSYLIGISGLETQSQ